MTADLRHALADLASEAPVLDVADRAIARGRERRRRTVIGAMAAAAVVAVAGPLLVSAMQSTGSTVAPPSSPSPELPEGAVPGFRWINPNLGALPWPWLDDTLPASLDEPIVIVLDTDDGGRAVIGSGRMFDLESGATAPAIAPDGRAIAWWNAEDQELVIHDLVLGTEHRRPAGRASNFEGIGIDPTVPMHWSPDGRTLAITSTDRDVTLVVADTAEATEVGDVRGIAAGWRDVDRLVVVDAFSAGDLRVTEVALDGTVTHVGDLQRVGTTTDLVPVLSPDGERLAALDSSTEARRVIEWRIDTGGRQWMDCGCPGQERISWAPEGSVIIRWGASGPPVFGRFFVNEAYGLETQWVITPRVGETRAISLAMGVPAEPSETFHTSSAWPGWYVDWILYTGAVLLAFAMVAVIRRWRRWRAPAPIAPRD